MPTPQHNGVAWVQLVIGNTVFVGGDFSRARPAGAAAGTNEVVRENILAYNLTTGELLPFAPSLNGEVTALAASPDGSRLYVGGSFTSFNGAKVWRAIALNPVTGALNLGFLPKMSASVRAIVATADTVFLGGLFNGVGSVSRDRLAAVSATDASLLPWNPVASGGRVNALALSPDGASMVVGGAFTSLNGSTNPGYGLGKVDTNLGALQPFQINNIVRNGGTSGSITSLATDGANVYGSGYTFGRSSTLEGIFSVKWSDDTTSWLEDCHGDTYSVQPIGDVVYAAGHAHYCGNVGGFPQEEPWQFSRGIAFSRAATGVVSPESHGYTNFAGNPAPSLLNWFPIMNAGTFTGQDQGPWTVAGSADYVVMAGEFTIVNNQPQQGMTRFAKSSIAPNARGPRVTGQNFNPTLSTPAAGEVRVRWQANWDQDNANLTYDVRRNGAVVATFNQASTFWKRPGMTFTDTGLVPGESYGYRIFVRDPFGNEARSDTVTIDAVGSVAPAGSYAGQVLADNPVNYWRLGESSGATAVDLAGRDDLVVRPGVTFGAAGALNGETNTAAAFNGTADAVAGSPTLVSRPGSFTTEAWIRTNSISGGRIIGYGNTVTGVSADYDRHVYMDNLGRIFFGVRPAGSTGTRLTVNTTLVFNNNLWHHVVATLGPNGMQIVVDGTVRAGRTDVTAAWPFDGYWRVGGDNLSNWPSRPTSRYLTGQIDDVAIYPGVLPLSRIQAHYVASGRTVDAPPAPPTAAFTAETDGLTVNVDGTASSDANGPIAAYDWKFGDGATGTGVKASHTYAAGGTYTIQLTVTDNTGNKHSTTKAVTVTAPPANKVPVASFTADVADLTASLDGSGSSDPDGTIAGYTWDFGDSTTGTGATATHTYAEAGTYAVKLTVTDDDGATGAVTKSLTVTAPAAGTVLAADAFGRSATGGWGTADTGGAWTVAGGNTNFAVNNGSGAATLGAAGASRSAFLEDVSTAAFDGRITLSADKVANGGGMFASLLGRRVSSNDYRAKVKIAGNGAVSLYLTRVVNNAETTIAGPLNISGLTMAASDPLVLRLRLEGTGPTAVSGKVWRASGAEPTTWQLTVNDSTAALQAAGAMGVVAYLSGSATNAPVVMRFDDLSVTAGGAPVANAAPVASFTSTVSGLSTSVDGSGSTDSDGTIAGYAWDFGDGSSGTGSTASHAYAAAGTYSVTLTVTDDDGATSSVTQPVAVSEGALVGVLAADAFGRTSASGWGNADTGGPWSIGGGGPASYTVGSGVGTMVLGAAGTLRQTTLADLSLTAAEIQVKVSQDRIANGGGSFLGVVGRKVSADEYRAKLRIFANGGTALYLTRVSGGAETTLQSVSVPGLTVAANDDLQLRLQVSGTSPTAIRAKVWRDGAAEPSDWLLTASDTTASLQSAGTSGLMSYLWGTATNFPVVARFDDFTVKSP
ncbi:PKD domain-containing protein [Pseudarthrobacter sp. NPDC058362]|uniref:PKD domain-containing protein n=1 Tax=Pseudarthrobacter sp. NPDC058362 TaxID=3346458 RepID=UPI00366001AB